MYSMIGRNATSHQTTIFDQALHQTTVFDQALHQTTVLDQATDNRQYGEDEVGENWYDGYFMDRDTEPIEDPIVVLPIKERRRRSRSPRQVPRQVLGNTMMWSNMWHFNNITGRWYLGLPKSATAIEQLLDLFQSVVPELQKRSDAWWSASRTIQLVLQTDTIHFAADYIAMSDDKMLRSCVHRAKEKKDIHKMYVGITENPVRRLHIHAHHGLWPGFINMLIVRVAFTSIETASWEKLAIQYFREQLGDHALLNRSEGGEGASGEIPHYGYILRFA